MSLTFGTDGVRADARTVLTPTVVCALAQAGAEVLGAEGFAVGRDPRESGPALAHAVHVGVADAGGVSADLGVLPTPAVARYCEDHQVAGAMISASHNPWHDNGVKFFGPSGAKLSDDQQAAVQARFDELLTTAADPAGFAVEPADRNRAALDAHRDAIVASLDGRDLTGLRIAVDAANGAASVAGPDTLRALGAEVHVLHAEPDGRNINDNCGSTHLESLAAFVVEHGLDGGVAFDGDADRMLAVDEHGELVDGDQIIAMCAIDAQARGTLTDNKVVVTVMSNLGFRRAMDAAGIDIVETKVGDRHVLAELDAHNLSLGGEQSGHVIFRDIAATGDGVLSAVQLLDVIKRSGHSLGVVAATTMVRLPQLLRNVRVATMPDNLDAQLAPFVAAAEQRMAGRGRVLIRASGTEPLIRVMVEAETDAEAAMEADGLVAAVESLFV